MIETPLPSQPTTPIGQRKIRFDPSYTRTIPGILKLIQIVLNILGFICIQASGIYSGLSRGVFFTFVATSSFCFTLMLFGLYLFHIVENFLKYPWLKLEGVICGMFAMFYLIASCLAVTLRIEAYIAAGVFGFCAMVAYGNDVFLKYNAIRNGESAQGDKIVIKPNDSITRISCIS